MGEGGISIADAKRIVGQSAILSNVERMELLDRGFSDDRKYILWERGDPVYLLRISSIEERGRRRSDFGLMQAHYHRGVKCSQPVEFGEDDSSGLCHILVGYIPGKTGSDELPKLSEQTQYEIGLDAGRELRKLHEMCHPDPDFNWFERRLAKYQRKVAQDREYGLTFRRQAKIQRYIELNIDLLRESPVCFQHDDYHPDNLIIREGKLEGIIDFNRCDWGDPVEDFYKVPWFSSRVSIAFAQGQVEGYSAEPAPKRFWERYNLLVALNIPGSRSYAHEQGMDWWPERLDSIIDDHDFADSGPPKWFVDPP